MNKKFGTIILLLVLCLLGGVNIIFADGPTPESPYYLTYYNSTDSTFHIILDGEYYEKYLHRKTINPRFPEQSFTLNPTDELLRRFLPSMICSPKENWLEPNQQCLGYRIVNTSNDLISRSTGICVDDHFLITTPSRTKTQYSIDVTIQDFGFEIIDHPEMWVKLVARTKIVNPSEMNIESSNIFPLIAIHKGEGLLLDLEKSLDNITLPDAVKSLVDSLQLLEKISTNQIEKYFNNEKIYDRLLRKKSRNISIQPFYAVPSSIELIHYLITIYYSGQISYSHSIIVNPDGKLLQGPINHKNKSIQQSRGIITYQGDNGPIQLLVISKSGFNDYSGGISLFRVSPDTTLNEITYFSTTSG